MSASLILNDRYRAIAASQKGRKYPFDDTLGVGHERTLSPCAQLTRKWSFRQVQLAQQCSETRILSKIVKQWVPRYPRHPTTAPLVRTLEPYESFVRFMAAGINLSNRIFNDSSVFCFRHRKSSVRLILPTQRIESQRTADISIRHIGFFFHLL